MVSYKPLLICILLLPQTAEAQRISKAIDQGTKVLLKSIDPLDEFTLGDASREGGTHKIRGKVIKRFKDTVHIEDENGKKITLNRRDIVQWLPGGMVRPEMDEAQFVGGPSALAALALANAGVDISQPQFAMLLNALANQELTETGTYVHSIRACVWSALAERPISKIARARYRKLLQDDVNWLARSGGPTGLYTYRSGGGGDHSNTQFANLGLWAGGICNVEISGMIWQKMARHWLETQVSEGGWGYSAGNHDIPTSSMTVAGCNSLYITLDRFYSRSDYPYAIFEGARPNKKAREAIARVYEAIRRGDTFLKSHPPDIGAFHGYELFGLERLGMASGCARIGGVDWFEAHAEQVANRTWGGNPIADAFALIFLVHGQAPILFQKLEHGNSFEDWNYYHRDLASLCRYLSKTFERIYRWQRVDFAASLEELQKAPILYISGSSRLELSKTLEANIHEYVSRGGTVFLHADRASKAFTASAERIFENIFRSEDYHFSELREDHPVFDCLFGSGSTPFKRHIPLRGMSDGSRTIVFSCPVDIAGAWHQDRDKLVDLFRIMANVRVYSVRPYGELIDEEIAQEPQSNVEYRGTLTIGRLKYSGRWNLHPQAWSRFAEDSPRRNGLGIKVKTVEAKDLSGIDVLHLSVARDAALGEGTIEAISKYIQGGGFLLIDAADGQESGVSSVGKIFEKINVGSSGLLEANDAIMTGKGIERGALGELKATTVGTGLSKAGAPPPILTKSMPAPEGGTRLAVMACPFDVIAGLDGPFIYNRRGFTHTSTLELVDRILLLRWVYLQSAGSSGK